MLENLLSDGENLDNNEDQPNDHVNENQIRSQ